jgi:ABC-type microcin C transport system permease subunit YejB
MGWDILKRMIDIIHFIILILMVSILFINNKSGEDNASFSLKLESAKQDMIKLVGNNTNYLEARLNRTDEKQDNYQNTSSNQIALITKRLEKVEQENKSGQKVIQNNLQIQNNN